MSEGKLMLLRAWDRMKQILIDPKYKDLKVPLFLCFLPLLPLALFLTAQAYTWEDFELSLLGMIEKHKSGSEIDFEAENRELKRNGKSSTLVLTFSHPLGERSSRPTLC
jgi:hypothetical protein